MTHRSILQGGLRRARTARKRIIEPKPNEIQVDLDSLRDLHVFSRQYRMLDSRGLTRHWRVKVAASFARGHVHVTIRLPRAKPLIERVYLAALLGSDLKREAFNYIRVRCRRKIPVAFFERAR